MRAEAIYLRDKMCYNRSRSLSQFFPFCLPFLFTPMFPRCVCTSVFVNVWAFIPLDFLGCVFISLDKVHNIVRMMRLRVHSLWIDWSCKSIEYSSRKYSSTFRELWWICYVCCTEHFVFEIICDILLWRMDLCHLFIYDRILIVYLRNEINKFIKITNSNQFDFWEVQVFCAFCIHTFST